MCNYYLRLLVALLCCLSLVQNAWCDNDDREEVSVPLEKGRFYQANVFGNKPKGCSVVYSADARGMQQTWNSSDFRLLNDVYSTGAYFENKIYSAESPTIHIPSISYNDRLFVCLEEMFEVESGYDYVSVDASIDYGETWKQVYIASGYSEEMVFDYSEVVGLENKDVKFKINLYSDSSYVGYGLSIRNFDVLLWQYEKEKNTHFKSELRSGNDEIDFEVNTPELKDILIKDVIWEDKNEGIISFYAEDTAGHFVSGDKINRNDINVTIKNEKTEIKIASASCFSWAENVKRKVDIALVVDYSGSMSNPINNMKDGLIDMCGKIDEKYDAMFSLCKYGYSFSINPSNNFSILKDWGSSLLNKGALTNLMNKESTKGGDEYVYHAIDSVSKQTYFRPNASRVMIVLYNMESSDCGNYYNKMAKNGKYSFERYTEDDIKKSVNDFLVYGILADDCDTIDIAEKFIVFCQDTIRYSQLGTNFNRIFNSLGNNLIQRNYLKISPNCIDKDLICGEDYKVSIEIKTENDTVPSTYSYPGYIIRSESTKKYDYNCVEKSDSLEISFFVNIGCGNDTLGKPIVYYGYGNENDTYSTTAEFGEDGLYYAKISKPNRGRLNYRIEQRIKDAKPTIVSPMKYSVLNSYWTTNVCSDVADGISFGQPVFSKCERKKDDSDFSMRVVLNNGKRDNNYVMYLFYSSENKDHISEWNNTELKTFDGVNYISDQLIYDTKTEAISYFLVYRDTLNKIEFHYGNGNDDIKKQNISEIKDILCVDSCNSVSLNSHILSEGNDILKFDVYYQFSKVQILLYDTLGNELAKEDITIKDREFGKEVSLIPTLGLREKNLKYTVPYLLVLRIDNKVTTMYVYLDKKKRK